MRESSEEISRQVWQEWILEAIRKIRFQKQRPSCQRICQAIGSHHKFHEDIVAEKLEEAVESGAVVKVYNKGLHSYKAPMARRRISVSKNTDLSKLIAKAVRELGECEGSTIKTIENYVQKSNNIELSLDADFKLIIKNSVKSAVDNDYLIQEGKLYKVGSRALTSYKTRVKKTATEQFATSSTASKNHSPASSALKMQCISLDSVKMEGTSPSKACDHNMVIRYVDARYPASTHDSFVWNYSELQDILRSWYETGERSCMYLGDSGYPLLPYLLTPYRNTSEGSREALFNKKHAKARNIIERTIGVLKNRFRCLLNQRVLYYSPEKATKVVNTCCALHNICRSYNVADPEEIDHVEIAITGETSTDGINNNSTEGERIRNAILASL